jgi:hypothetical protein
VRISVVGVSAFGFWIWSSEFWHAGSREFGVSAFSFWVWFGVRVWGLSQKRMVKIIFQSS